VTPLQQCLVWVIGIIIGGVTIMSCVDAICSKGKVKEEE
jgi:hypothetical protein